MALSVKYISKQHHLAEDRAKLKENEAGDDVTNDDVIIALTADLQQLQDEETKQVLEMIQDKVCKRILGFY